MNPDTLLTVLGLVALLSMGAWFALKSRPVFRPRPRQPVPEVTLDDVRRVVRREFPSTQFEEVMVILNAYTSTSEGIARIQLAALRLAGGHIDSLQKHIAAANLDYRDVLAAAEYAGYGKATSRGRSLPRSEHQRLIDADWKQYENWLRK